MEFVMAEGPSDALFDLLRPQRLTAIVDVGANPIDGIPPYQGMLAKGLCTLVGFEPQPDALARLDQRKGPRERYLPYAIGDGRKRVLYVCANRGMTSLLEPDRERLALFNNLGFLGMVENKRPIATRRLDDVQELDHLDLLKIDIQGSELDVFKGGRRLLRRAVAVQTEISFVPIYRDQPAFGTVDIFLRAMGFVPHCFTNIRTWTLAPMAISGNPHQAVNQLLEADMVYVRDFCRQENMDAEQWKHLALIAHHCYGSTDLTLRAIAAAASVGGLPQGAPERYLDLLASLSCRSAV
jgi:FkbM family methyltransferase